MPGSLRSLPRKVFAPFRTCGWLRSTCRAIWPVRAAEWEYVLSRLDGFKFWSGQLDWNAHDVPRALVRLFAQRQVAIISERMYWPPLKPEGQSDVSHGAAGPWNASIADRAAENELRRTAAVERIGGRLACIDVDDPMRNLIHPHWPARFGGGLSSDEAVDALVRYMLTVQRRRPEVGFFVIVNFPLWGWRGEPSYVGNEFLGDYHRLVVKILDHAEAQKRLCTAGRSTSLANTRSDSFEHRGWPARPGTPPRSTGSHGSWTWNAW